MDMLLATLKMDFPPKLFENVRGLGRHIFLATSIKLKKFIAFLEMYKSYYYHFLIYSTVQMLPKMLKSSSPSVQSSLANLTFLTAFDWRLFTV